MASRKTHPAEYEIWAGMLQRCYNPNKARYADYGGRGIEVCQRWRTSFNNFLADMGTRPPGLSIDRMNNDGHYEPGNCRWATAVEQARNSRKDNLYVEYKGEMRLLVDVAAETGIKYPTLRKRYSLGERGERLFTMSRNTRHDVIVLEHDGRVQTLAEWARETNQNPAIIWQRLYKLNYSVARALENKDHRPEAVRARAVHVTHGGVMKTVKEWCEETGRRYSDVMGAIRCGVAPEQALGLQNTRIRRRLPK